MRDYFMRTARIGFSTWSAGDLPLAERLWGDGAVTRFICASGRFTPGDIAARLETEIGNGAQFKVQYWPIFALETGGLIGCCGLRPFAYEVRAYELGCHLCRDAWGMGYATEGARAVIRCGFDVLEAERLYAGHHPENSASEHLLRKLGFSYIGRKLYEPTGLYHPSYELVQNKIEEKYDDAAGIME